MNTSSYDIASIVSSIINAINVNLLTFLTFNKDMESKPQTPDYHFLNCQDCGAVPSPRIPHLQHRGCHGRVCLKWWKTIGAWCQTPECQNIYDENMFSEEAILQEIQLNQIAQEFEEIKQQSDQEPLDAQEFEDTNQQSDQDSSEIANSDLQE